MFMGLPMVSGRKHQKIKLSSGLHVTGRKRGPVTGPAEKIHPTGAFDGTACVLVQHKQGGLWPLFLWLTDAGRQCRLNKGQAPVGK